ncbi:MAG: glycosyltransferase family 39 protein [Thermoanaerobaculia bacterium]|jgi:hypothetical protein
MNEPGAAQPRSDRYPSIVAAALVFFAATFVRLRLLPAPLERDEGEFAYIGQLMLNGFAPFAHAYSMKLPGTSAAYALIMSVLGQNSVGIHLGLLVVNAACVVLLHLLARRLLGPECAWFASASYAAMSVSMAVLGVLAHATHFVVLFTLAGLLLLRRAEDHDGGVWLLASGFCFGLAITMKQHAAIFLLFGCLVAWRSGRERRGARWLATYARPALVLAGAVILGVIVLLVMAQAGALDAMWFWTVRYARAYVSAQPAAGAFRAFSGAVALILQSQMPFWFLAAAGAFDQWRKAPSIDDRTFMAGFGLFSLAAVMPGWYFRPHYFVMLLPSVALFAAASIRPLGRLVSSAGFEGARRYLPPFLLLASTAFVGLAERDALFRESPATMSRSVNGENPFPEAVEVAAHVRSLTSAGDRIAVLGSEPEIYFYSGRLSATGYIYMYGLFENQPYASTMQRELISEIESARPKCVVFVDVPNSWGVMAIPPGPFRDWMDSFLAGGYELVGVADMVDPFTTRYVWGRTAAAYTPVSRSVLKVYRRR